MPTTTVVMGLVGALALALGLSFGLGGRETAGKIVQSWCQSGKEAAPKIELATDVAKQEAQSYDAREREAGSRT